jgi:hypothetical protein
MTAARVSSAKSAWRTDVNQKGDFVFAGNRNGPGAFAGAAGSNKGDDGNLGEDVTQIIADLSGGCRVAFGIGAVDNFGQTAKSFERADPFGFFSLAGQVVAQMRRFGLVSHFMVFIKTDCQTDSPLLNSNWTAQ